MSALITFRRIGRSSVCVLLAIAASLSLSAKAQSTVTLLLVNGKFWTANPDQPEAEAVALAGNRIAAVGTTAAIEKWKQPGVTSIDLDGHRVLPGFNDAHVHFLAGGTNLTGPQLRLSKSQTEFRDTLAAFAKTQPKGRWITGGNWDHENWTPARLPDRALIDGVTADWPVMIKRLDGHMSLANSVALRLAGVDKGTRDVPGGVIVRDGDGAPTGILKDAAQGLVQKVIPPPSEQQIIEAVRAAQTYANAQGVTSVQDMAASPPVFKAYQTMLHNEQLRVRISGHQPLTTWQQLASVGLRANFGNEYLHIGGLKGYADGSLGSTTALLFEPYLDSPNTNGIASAELSDAQQMWHIVSSGDEAGLQIAIHAIGDRANHEVLGMYERIEREHGERDRRLRIEHAQHLIAADVPRFGRMHVIASMQPYHCIDDGRWAEKRIGPERAKMTYAFRTLLDTGATLAFGSDWDIAPMSPTMGIYAAVTRRTLDGKRPDGWVPEQKITVAEAVQAYTSGSAYASFDEKLKGSIEPGKLADFVVLTDDIFAIDPVKIADTKVTMTIFDGKMINPAEPPYRTLPSGLLFRR